MANYWLDLEEIKPSVGRPEYIYDFAAKTWSMCWNNLDVFMATMRLELKHGEYIMAMVITSLHHKLVKIDLIGEYLMLNLYDDLTIRKYDYRRKSFNSNT